MLKESDYLLAEEGETFTVTDDEIYNSNKVEFALDMKVCLLNCMCLYLHVSSVCLGYEGMFIKLYEPISTRVFYLPWI